MNLNDRIPAFVKLGEKIKILDENKLQALIQEAHAQNPWFTESSIKNAFGGIVHMLEKEKLEKWLCNYKLEPSKPKTVGIVMAGNIPLVGFHDLLCVLLSGNIAAIKMSTQDEVLTRKILDWILEIEPRFNRMISLPEKLIDIDAVIATGSNNTSRYFEYYFGKYPNIIRKNRTSVAVLSGNETEEEIKNLGKDIFDYFGLGCRNVSKIFIPKDHDIKPTLGILEKFCDIIYHNKYKNNYDYHKSILLVNKIDHLDTGFALFVESGELVSPTSVIYYEYYDSLDKLHYDLNKQSDRIQCIIGRDKIPNIIDFGMAQRPEPWDYADRVDTLHFLEKL